MKNKIRNFAIIGAIISTVSFGSTFTAFAEDVDTTTTATTSIKAKAADETGRKFMTQKGNQEDWFANLVAEGVVDQETADKMTAYMEENREEMQAERETEKAKIDAMTEEERKAYFESREKIERPNIFTEMVTAGILTEDQADAINGLMPQEGNAKELNFNAFVEDSTISQGTADDMTAYVEEKREEMQAEREAEKAKIDAMTEEERKAYFESRADIERTDMFAEMVTDGIITQEECDAMKAKMPERDGMRMKDFHGFHGYVENGVISQETADKIMTYMEAKKETMKDSTIKVEKDDILAEMVSEGIITQEEADAMKEAAVSVKIEKTGRHEGGFGGNKPGHRSEATTTEI